ATGMRGGRRRPLWQGARSGPARYVGQGNGGIVHPGHLHNLAARRFMEVRKMKNGRQNIAMDFFMDEFSFTAFRKVEKDGVETLEQMDVKTLTVRWDGEIHPTEQKHEEDEIPPAQHKMLVAMKDLMQTKGVEHPEAPGRAIASSDWEGKCLKDRI